MLYADLSICMGKTTPWVLRCRSYEWLRTKIDELTYFFTSEEIKYMNPQIFSSSDKFTPRLWFQWSWLHIAWHIIAFNKTKAIEKKNICWKRIDQLKLLRKMMTSRTYWFASQNFTLEPSAVVMNLPSWLTSALVTDALVSRVWTIFPVLTSHNLHRAIQIN